MATSPDWRAWLTRWDAQQEAFNPDRELRFEVMFDLLAAALPSRFRVLDLGAGPGSLSLRLLRRFPHARSVAVDYDPVVLRIGREALGDAGGRLAWIDAQLGAPGWTRALPRGRFDAAVSTTALHWLRPRALRRLYRDLAGRLRPGGLFLDGDRIAFDPELRTFAELVARARRRRSRGPAARRGWSAWEAWWRAAERLPELRTEFRERARRHAEHPTTGDLPIGVHLRALRRAGFRAAGVLWQNLDDRIVGARR